MLAATAAITAPVAGAKTTCRDRIYADWRQDGKVASTYPLSCYRDALRHIPNGDSVYTSLADDIRAAFQAAVARSHGKQVAAQVGHGSKQPDPNATMMDERTHPLASATIAAAPASDSGGGVPIPLIVLGALALALLIAGGIGLAVRASRGSAPGA
jgi:hypothetical protein